MGQKVNKNKKGCRGQLGENVNDKSMVITWHGRTLKLLQLGYKILSLSPKSRQVAVGWSKYHPNVNSNPLSALLTYTYMP